ncbi:hypothetical protein [Salicibibacter halophilus]|nr:hypothetical protein [Salicibibacter halophilus]
MEKEASLVIGPMDASLIFDNYGSPMECIDHHRCPILFILHAPRNGGIDL